MVQVLPCSIGRPSVCGCNAPLNVKMGEARSTVYMSSGAKHPRETAPTRARSQGLKRAHYRYYETHAIVFPPQPPCRCGPRRRRSPSVHPSIHCNSCVRPLCAAHRPLALVALLHGSMQLSLAGSSDDPSPPAQGPTAHSCWPACQGPAPCNTLEPSLRRSPAHANHHAAQARTASTLLSPTR